MSCSLIRFARSGRGKLAAAAFGALPLIIAMATPAAAAPEVVSTIPVGLDPGAVAVNPATDTIYVANEGVTPDNTVSVIDGRTSAITSTITVGSSAAGIAVNPVTDTVYVTDSGYGLYVIDGKTNKIAATIPISGGMASKGRTASPSTR